MAVDVGKRAAAVGAFLIERHKAISSNARDEDLEFAFAVYDFEGAAGPPQVWYAGQVDHQRVFFNLNGIGRRFGKRATIPRGAGQARTRRAAE